MTSSLKMLGRDWGGDPKPRVGPLGMAPVKRGGPVRKKVEEFGPIMYVDILGPVIGITDERSHVLTVQDWHSKYAVATFISHQESAKVVETLMAIWIPSFGLPGSIRSEKGKEFKDQVWRALCDQNQNCYLLNIHSILIL